MSTMVNIGIGFKEPLTRPGIKSHLLFDSATRRGYTNSSLLEEGAVIVRKYHAMLFLRTCMSWKWM